MEKVNFIYRKKEHLLEFDRVDSLIDPQLKRKIRITVLSVHVGLLAILIIYYLISNFFITPKPALIQVTLITPNQTFSDPTPSSTKSPLPVHKTRKRKRKTTTPKKKRLNHRVKRKKPLLSSKDIKISKKIIKNDPVDDLVPISAVDVQKQFRKSYRDRKIQTKHTPGSQPSGNLAQNYMEKVSSIIYKIWEQPGKSELRGRQPTVDIKITVNSAGKIINSRIISKSGVSVMDISARRLLRDLTILPKPPNGTITFTVTLEIVDD